MGALTAFQTAVAKELASKGLEVGPWRGATRRSANLIEIDTKPKSTVLYVKESNSSPGFWGLTKNQLVRLDETQVRWFVVLLARSSDSGYILSRDEVNRQLQNGTFELSQDGDHKVNERKDLAQLQAFRGIKNLLTQVL